MRGRRTSSKSSRSAASTRCALVSSPTTLSSQHSHPTPSTTALPQRSFPTFCSLALLSSPGFSHGYSDITSHCRALCRLPRTLRSVPCRARPRKSSTPRSHPPRPRVSRALRLLLLPGRAEGWRAEAEAGRPTVSCSGASEACAAGCQAAAMQCNRCHRTEIRAEARYE